MSNPDPLRLLERAGRHLAAVPCRDTRRVFERLAAAVLAGVDAREALGLTAVDAREQRLRLRNYHLLRALDLMPPGSIRYRCKELRAEIATFEAVIWPRWRDLAAPPDGASQLRAALFHAIRAGRLPTTARQLVNIARETRSVSISRKPSDTYSTSTNDEGAPWHHL